ncbi:MAG: carboxymuconolactone decarboxylase family protein [Burkholderiaceae bacterium]|nr:carboxymuconolactone decarboxylase family protein [Burkholderiaceae bacterium]
MKTISVPTYEEVSPANQEIFDELKKKHGFVFNLYATFAHSETALANFLALQREGSSLSPKAREVVSLVVSEVNSGQYCLAAHTIMGKVLGFSDDQLLELRGGHASFDPCLEALVVLTRSIVVERGRPAQEALDDFFKAGWTEGNLVDLIMLIGETTISNYLHGATQIRLDLPAAPNIKSSTFKKS